MFLFCFFTPLKVRFSLVCSIFYHLYMYITNWFCLTCMLTHLYQHRLTITKINGSWYEFKISLNGDSYLFIHTSIKFIQLWFFKYVYYSNKESFWAYMNLFKKKKKWTHNYNNIQSWTKTSLFYCRYLRLNKIKINKWYIEINQKKLYFSNLIYPYLKIS